jgi:hypothetical protein
MKLKVDAIVSPVLFEEEDTGLVELAIVAPEDEDKYPFVRLSSAPADLMDRLGRVIEEHQSAFSYDLMGGFASAKPSFILERRHEYFYFMLINIFRKNKL